MLDNTGKILSFGVLYDATPGNDYCNGYIAPLSTHSYACIVDCLHMDDVAAILAEKGLEERPVDK